VIEKEKEKESEEESAEGREEEIEEEYYNPLSAITEMNMEMGMFPPPYYNPLLYPPDFTYAPPFFPYEGYIPMDPMSTAAHEEHDTENAEQLLPEEPQTIPEPVVEEKKEGEEKITEKKAVKFAEGKNLFEEVEIEKEEEENENEANIEEDKEENSREETDNQEEESEEAREKAEEKEETEEHKEPKEAKGTPEIKSQFYNSQKPIKPILKNNDPKPIPVDRTQHYLLILIYW
jgi:hypothetical protein